MSYIKALKLKSSYDNSEHIGASPPFVIFILPGLVFNESFITFEPLIRNQFSNDS